MYILLYRVDGVVMAAPMQNAGNLIQAAQQANCAAICRFEDQLGIVELGAAKQIVEVLVQENIWLAAVLPSLKPTHALPEKLTSQPTQTESQELSDFWSTKLRPGMPPSAF